MGKWIKQFLIGLVSLVAILGLAVFVILQFVTVNVPFAFANAEGNLAEITLPDGFEIAYFAQEVDGARSLRMGDNGTLFISSRRASNVYAIPNATDSNSARDVITIASGLNSPNGIEIVDGDLYVAEINRIIRFDDIENNLNNPQFEVVTDALPTEGHHGWRYIGYAPDGHLYISIGAPCNVCELEEMFGTIHRMDLDGSNLEEYATGVRNSVGFDFHPETGDLWFTNNGRDLMGDDIPPDTLHHAPKSGLHFGFPYCHAGDIPDPQFGDMRSCDESTPPAYDLSPHGAALGMRFYTGEMFPDNYSNHIIVAEHGSWNRSVPIGYRLMLAELDDTDTVLSYQPFAEGWLNEETGSAWGRPVDVLVMPDGSLLVSDDQHDAVYRISYNG